MIAAATMLRLAEDTRVTVPIMTDAAEIRPAFVGEENIGAEIDALTGAFEPATDGRQSIEINGIVIDRHQHIGVVRIGLVVVSDPMSAMRFTPGQSRADRTNAPTASSKCRRGSGTEGNRGWDRGRRIETLYGAAAAN